jgi:membrane protein YdbS with pleckstrin-like domain
MANVLESLRSAWKTVRSTASGLTKRSSQQGVTVERTSAARVHTLVQAMVMQWLLVLAFRCRIWSLFSSTQLVSMALAALFLRVTFFYMRYLPRG